MAKSAHNYSKKSVNSGLKLLAKSSVFVLISLLISNLLTYAYRLIIAREYGSGAYGAFSLVTAVLGIFVGFFALGITSSVEKFLPSYRGEKNLSKARYLVNFSLIVTVISGLIGGTVLFFSADFIARTFFHDLAFVPLLKVFSILIPVWMLSNLFLSTLISFERFGWYSFLSNVLPGLSRVAVIATLVVIGIGTNSIYVSYFVSWALLMIIAGVILSITIKPIAKKVSAKEKSLVRAETITYAWPFIFYAIVAKTSTWLDSLSIGYFMNVSDVGLYNAATPIALLLLLASQIFLQLFTPLINKEYSRKNYGLIKQMSQQVGKWIFMVNLPVFILFFIFPGSIINILFGKEFLVADSVLRILVVGAFISSLFSPSEKLVLMKGKSRWTMFNVMVTIIINLALNIVLIPMYGINGAAVATAATWVLLSIILTAEGYYLTSILPLRRKMLRVAIVSLIPLVIIWIMKSLIPITFLSLVVMVVTFFIVYIVLLFITGCLDENDKLVYRAFKRKFFGVIPPIRAKNNVENAVEKEVVE